MLCSQHQSKSRDASLAYATAASTYSVSSAATSVTLRRYSPLIPFKMSFTCSFPTLLPARLPSTRSQALSRSRVTPLEADLEKWLMLTRNKRDVCRRNFTSSSRSVIVLFSVKLRCRNPTLPRLTVTAAFPSVSDPFLHHHQGRDLATLPTRRRGCLQGGAYMSFDYTPQPELHHQDKRVNDVIAHVCSRYPEFISLKQAARVACLEYHYFSAYFRHVVGETFLRWQLNWRIRRASQELRLQSSVTRAAHLAGYRDVTAFTRAFKRIYGLTPQFKNRLRQES
jgi:AraC-like DNA-binding protein